MNEWRFFWVVILLAAGMLLPHIAMHAAEPGLPFTEDFVSDALEDALGTTAQWSTEQQAVLLPCRTVRHYGSFSGTVLGRDISADIDYTAELAAGDLDGDGDLDLVVGNAGISKYYLNTGSADPFSGVLGIALSDTWYPTKSVALGDLNGDGALDIVLGNDGQAIVAILNNRSSAPFDSVAPVAISSDVFATRSVVLGDFNGDGHLDLAAGNAGQPNRYYLNNGTEDPFSGVSGADISTDAYSTTSIAAADINGDGHLDILAGYSDYGTRFFANTGMSAPFDGSAGAGIGVGTTVAVAVGDMDSDGDLDVLAGNTGESVQLYLNNGTLSPFSGASGVPVTAGPNPVHSLSVGDVDQDGDLDLLIGNFGQVNEVYLNAGGTNPFGGISGVPVGSSADPTESVLLADFDSDGQLDAATGNMGTVNQLFVNEGSRNPYAKVEGLNLSSDAFSTYALAVGDIDRDGDLDLVGGHNIQATRLYLNNGMASPFDGVSGLDITAEVKNTYAVAIGDVDHDGDLDVVTGNQNQPCRLFLNTGASMPFSGVTGMNITSDAYSTRAIALGDVDHDGDLDLVTGNYNYPTGQANRLYLNNGSEDPFSGVSGTDVGMESDITNTINLADMNGDGLLDVVSGNTYYSRIYLNNGTISPFAGAEGVTIGTTSANTLGLAIGDINQDGRPDVVMALTSTGCLYYLNNGTDDPFDNDPGSIITTAEWCASAGIADFNGDGYPDVVTGNRETGHRVFLNHGGTVLFQAGENYPIGADISAVNALAIADFNQDGTPDVVFGNGNNERDRLYLNGGSGISFGGITATALSSDTNDIRCVVTGDLNRDGAFDVVAGANGSSRVYLSNGGAEPFAGVTGMELDAESHDTRAVALADMNNDGALDILAAHYNDPTRLYLNNGTLDPFTGVTGVDITADSGPACAIASGDMDLDGHLDVIVGIDGQPNRLYLNNGTDAPFDGVSGANITEDVYPTRAIAAGDVNADGYLDVVTGNYGEKKRVYLNNGSANPFDGVSGSDVTLETYDTNALVLADINSDGHLDILTGNGGASGQRNRAYINNGTSAPFGGITRYDIGAEADITRSILVADLNNDGHLDVLAGNTGAPNRLYINNGTSSPFSGVPGIKVSSESNATSAVAAAEMVKDGVLEIVCGNNAGPLWLFHSKLYNTVQNRVTSLAVDTLLSNIADARLTALYADPSGSSISWYLSNDGGGRWSQVRPGSGFVFPVDGNDLRWRAALHTLSPAVTPVITQVFIESPVVEEEGEGSGVEGEGEGVEGEGEGVEGEGEGQVMVHSADQNGDGVINLSELLRVIQFFNSGGLHCQAGTEDGYAPGPGDQSCVYHSSDYNSADWLIGLSELLRLIQFFNSGGYHACEGTEDGFCPGL